jgi:hypothetical protein
MAATNEARIWCVLAASGSGKGVWIKQQLRELNPPRLVVYDYKNEYQEHAPGPLYETLAPVLATMRKAGTGPARVRFRSKRGTKDKQRQREFEGLCSLVQAWGNCTFVAEELSNVTTASWAPPAWREMTTGGRHENVHIIGVAQNPALIDKTFMSNATLLHVGPLRRSTHRQAAAADMDCPVERLAALRKFHWLELDANEMPPVLRDGATFPPGYRLPGAA